MSLDRIDPRDADFTAFEDQVIVRVVLVDPSGEPHRGKVDDGAKLSWLDGDGNEQQVRLSPIRVR